MHCSRKVDYQRVDQPLGQQLLDVGEFANCSPEVSYGSGPKSSPAINEAINHQVKRRAWIIVAQSNLSEEPEANGLRTTTFRADYC